MGIESIGGVSNKGTPHIVKKAGNSQGLKEACGVFACSFEKPLDLDIYLEKGLKGLQHRGEDGAGIAFVDHDNRLKTYRTRGLVPDLIHALGQDTIKSHQAIGHVRYGTCGHEGQDLVQPLAKENLGVAIAFNGQIETGRFKSDTERLLDLFLTFTNEFESSSLSSGNDFKLIQGLTKASDKEAFSVLALYEGKIYAYRDANGTRPLFMAHVEEGQHKGIALASETCAFNHFDVLGVKEIRPGSLHIIEKGQVLSVHESQDQKKKFCAFEALYFSREDSYHSEGLSYYDIRKALGRALALADRDSDQTMCDIVVGVPQSGMPAALGYSNESGIALEFGLIKSRYQGRSFIQPSEGQRKQVLEEKLQIQASAIRGKRVLVVDDTLVRGHTMKHIVKMLRRAGAASVHVRIGAPPILSPCSKGVDTGRETSLPASDLSHAALRDHIGADSLRFLTLNMLEDVLGQDNCQACFL